MTTLEPKQASAAQVSNLSSWTDVVPKDVVAEDSMSSREVAKTWDKMYGFANMGSASEKERKALRAAVYVYCCLNGTSREGNYAGVMRLSNGQEVNASVIPQAAGKMHIRKFMRGNMNESYVFFKESQVMESYERFVARAAGYGISADCAFAIADWLDDCAKFTPGESRAHGSVFTKSIERSRRARGGKSLEEVEDARIDATIQANGPSAGDKGTAFEW